jgi:DNA primase
MTDLKAIKKRILREDCLIDIYESMGCESIAVRGKRIEAGLPEHFNSTNKRCVQTKFNEHLTSSIRNRGDFTGDIFSLVSYIVNNKRGSDIQKDLNNAKTFICETLGWREYLKGGEFEKRIDYLAPMKAILKGRKRKREIKPNPVLPEEILNQYLPYPSYSWMEEGISLRTQKVFDVRFDLESKRIILPMRNRFGKLIGVKGRILKDNDDDRKYLYLYPFNNSQELFNFHFAHQYILMEKKVYIFEGEKSVLKMFDAGIYNCVAVGSSDLTDVQASIIKNCGLDIEVILCYDNDKMPKDFGLSWNFDNEKQISSLPAEVQMAVKLFSGRKTYVMLDLAGCLPPKSSPIDSGVATFNKLEKENCYQIDSELITLDIL